MGPDQIAEDPPRRRRHTGRTLLIVLLVLVVLVIAADRIGLIVAERTVATQTRQHLVTQGITLSGDPGVHIAGFPFLTQVASGSYDEIDINTKDPSGKGIRMDSLNVTATGVKAPTRALISGNGSVTASRVVGTGKLAWSSFGQVVNLTGLQQFGIDGNSLTFSGTDAGKIAIAAPLVINGQTYQLHATGAVTVVHNVLHVAIDNVTADGTLPDQAQSQLNAMKPQLNFDVPLPALPYHLQLDAVTTTAAGVTITASASDVVLAG